jgi:hypothetical protein
VHEYGLMDCEKQLSEKCSNVVNDWKVVNK